MTDRQTWLDLLEGKGAPLKVAAPDLTSKAKPGERVMVTYPVSITYNGGAVINGQWYSGYEVPPPIVPRGYKLVGLGVGLQMNAHPPYATAMLEEDT